MEMGCEAMRRRIEAGRLKIESRRIARFCMEILGCGGTGSNSNATGKERLREGCGNTEYAPTFKSRLEEKWEDSNHELDIIEMAVAGDSLVVSHTHTDSAGFRSVLSESLCEWLGNLEAT